MTLLVFGLDARNTAGLIASLGCLLTTLILLIMLADWDRPRDQRGWEQTEAARGLFDDSRHRSSDQ
jgi:hypothetical protein